MKDLIKEVALDVDAKKSWVGAPSQQEVIEFATAFLAELSKRAEAVGYYAGNGVIGWTGNYSMHEVERPIKLKENTKLFTFPPIHDIEAIENRVAEACIKAIKSIDDGEAPEYSHCLETLGSGEWRKHK